MIQLVNHLFNELFTRSETETLTLAESDTRYLTLTLSE